MKKILIDNRWNGTGGIGTFAHEVNKINAYDDAGFSGAPYDPLDFIKTSLKLLKKRGRVLFFPGYIPPIYSQDDFVFTIHDLNHLDRKENASLFKKIFYHLVILRGCKKAKYIFTVSDFSKNRIAEWSGIDNRKIINVGNGVSEEFKPNGEILNYGFEYILCVSNRKAHKNELRTLLAFKNANLPLEIKLLFTGKSTEEINKYIKDLNLTDRVYFSGYLKQEELPKLYRGAKALIFVSLYEGFGLPVVEAMASGIPVITSTTTSLPEVAGEAALLVDPTNIQAIAEAIKEIYYNEKMRARLIARGLNQAKKYSWDITARKISEILSKI
ncbi:glycosyltransferase family 4 protein [Serratia fonticola]